MSSQTAHTHETKSIPIKDSLGDCLKTVKGLVSATTTTAEGQTKLIESAENLCKHGEEINKTEIAGIRAIHEDMQSLTKAIQKSFKNVSPPDLGNIERAFTTIAEIKTVQQQLHRKMTMDCETPRPLSASSRGKEHQAFLPPPPAKNQTKLHGQIAPVEQNLTITIETSPNHERDMHIISSPLGLPALP